MRPQWFCLEAPDGPHVTPDPVDEEQHLRELVLPECPVWLKDQEWTHRPQCGFLLCEALTVGPRVSQGVGGIGCRRRQEGPLMVRRARRTQLSTVAVGPRQRG